MKATAEIQAILIGAGVSVRREVQRAHELLEQSGLILETHASGTNVEGDLAQILQALERVHAVLHAEGTVGSSVFKCEPGRKGPSGPGPSDGSARSTNRSPPTPDSGPGSGASTGCRLTSDHRSAW